jgi:hypothetical protein
VGETKRSARIFPAALLVLGFLLPAAFASGTAELVAQERFTPDRLGSSTNLSLTAELPAIAGEAQPERVTKLTLYAPAGLGVDARGALTCSRAALEQRGPPACPARSRVGFGGGVGVLALPSRTIRAHFTLDFFFASTRPGALNLLAYASTTSPLIEELVLVAREVPAPKPYGLGFSVEVPPIATLPGAAPASLESVFASLGAANVQYYERVHGRRKLVALRGLLVPKSCPRGGWLAEAAVIFADGGSLTVHPRVPCPAG